MNLHVTRITERFLFILFLLFPNVFAQNKNFKGRTEPFYFSTISATVPGRISRILCNVGKTVNKGDVILHLEKDEEELEAARRKIVAESKVEVISAQHRLALIKKDYEATKELFDSLGSVSEDELWAKELEYKHAVGEYKRLEKNEEREEIEYKIALSQLKKRKIFAPFSGEVVKVFLREGESCNAQEPLIKLVNVNKCRFISHIEPAYSQDFEVGKSVNLYIDSGKSTINRTATIEYISSVIDPKSGLLEVRAVFPNADKKIKPGGLGRMTLQ